MKLMFIFILAIPVYCFAQRRPVTRPAPQTYPATSMPPKTADTLTETPGTQIATTESGRKVKLYSNGTWEFVQSVYNQPAVSGFRKETSGQDYYLSGSVLVTNDDGKKVPVRFEASVPKVAWDSLAASWKDNESQYFLVVAEMLTYDAKRAVKNNDAFQAEQKQFFTYENGQFTCLYKVTARNADGKIEEKKLHAKYAPKEY